MTRLRTPANTVVRFALFYTAGWLPLTLIMVAGVLQSQRAEVAGAMQRSLAEVILAAVLGVPIWPLSGSLENVSRTKAVAAYVGAGIAYSVALAFGLLLVDLTLTFSGGMEDGPHWTPSIVIGAFFLYGILVTAIVAVRSAMRAERARREAAASEQARVSADAMRARAELQALRAHLDPHFLYNTLNAIAAVVETDPAQARQLLVRAGSLLRRVLDLGAAGRDTASVADEWAMVSEYLAFEQLRMGDRLEVISSFSDDALECEVPAFLLQPLVENAIRHGLFPQPGRGALRISGEVVSGRLHLRVADSGGGASATAPGQSAGLGLRATRQRVQIAYNGAGRVEIETSPGNGFSVHLILPLEVVAQPVAVLAYA
jgi:two-component system LytT family sensor kinase